MRDSDWHLCKCRDGRGKEQGRSAAAEIGAGWKKTSREGREYLSVTIDDASLPQPINAALFEAADTEEYFLTWQRQ